MYPTEVVEGVLSRVSQEWHEAQRKKRREYFLKGPVKFDWIRENIPDPTSRVILVVRAFMDMDGTRECVLSKKIWDCAGITDRYQRRRVLKRIRDRCGNYRVVDSAGRPSVLQFVDSGNTIEGVPASQIGELDLGTQRTSRVV